MLQQRQIPVLRCKQQLWAVRLLSTVISASVLSATRIRSIRCPGTVKRRMWENFDSGKLLQKAWLQSVCRTNRLQKWVKTYIRRSHNELIFLADVNTGNLAYPCTGSIISKRVILTWVLLSFQLSISNNNFQGRALCFGEGRFSQTLFCSHRRIRCLERPRLLWVWRVLRTTSNKSCSVARCRPPG